MANSTKLFVSFLVLLFLGAIFAYFYKLDEPISTVRATRPVLVFTLIVAMLGFGGMLMAKSLFGSGANDEFTLRFRHAREVFLVYAGIFGTVIGFYFGAADEGDVSIPPSASIAFRGLDLSVQVSGGTPPFSGYLQQSSPKLEVVLAADGRRLTAKLDDNAPCPTQGDIHIIDGQGRRTSSGIKMENLVGWGAKCPAANVSQESSVLPSNAADAGSGETGPGNLVGVGNASGVAAPE